MKIALLGAAGGIGQPLGLLLKTQMPSGSHLSLYDISPATPGIAEDLAHIPTNVSVSATNSDLKECLTGADIVLISAGIARKPGMTRADLFDINASIIADLAQNIAKYSPEALIGIITNPVNSTVPIAAKQLKEAGVFNKNKLFGITTLDSIRAQHFVGDELGKNPEEIFIPIVGGHSGITILPLLSQYKEAQFSAEQTERLTFDIQNAGTKVVELKAGAGSATLSMAYAAYKFATSLIRAKQGEANVVEYSFIESPYAGLEYFSQPILLGKDGIEKVLPMDSTNDFEKKQFEAMLPSLQEDIEKGLNFTKK